MNCESARNRILTLTDPAAPPEPLQRHIEGCVTCKSWHALLMQVELAVASIPLPVSKGGAKRQLLSQFPTAKANKPAARAATPPRVAKPVKSPVSPAAKRQPLGERLARLWPAGLVAAAVLVGAVTWAILGGGPKDASVVAQTPHPMLAKVVEAKVKLDTAPNTAVRVDVLANLSKELHDEAGALSKVTPGEEMDSLAAMYRQVVQEALVPHAKALTEEERKTTLPKYRQLLEETEQSANRLAEEAPVGSKIPLKEIAEAAKSGRIELAKLIQGRAL